jgi:hypothetical protein
MTSVGDMLGCAPAQVNAQGGMAIARGKVMHPSKPVARAPFFSMMIFSGGGVWQTFPRKINRISDSGIWKTFHRPCFFDLYCLQ